MALPPSGRGVVAEKVVIVVASHDGPLSGVAESTLAESTVVSIPSESWIALSAGRRPSSPHAARCVAKTRRVAAAAHVIAPLYITALRANADTLKMKIRPWLRINATERRWPR